jgi:hypothetical protein
MKHVNLKEFNIDELSVTFWVSLGDELVQKMGGVVAPDEDGDYVFMESYKIGNVAHYVAAVVSKPKFVEGQYRIQIICEKKSGRKWAAGAVSVSKLFEIISSIKEKIPAMGMLSLSFGQRKKYKTIISLPMKITDMPKALYDEIDGVHFVKREGKLLKYDVILDLEPNKTLTEWLTFRIDININESILEDVMREGLSIADGFVSRGEQ